MKNKGLKAINKAAKRLEEKEVFGMGDIDINVATGQPVGCTTIFDTGWETNPRPTMPMGNCISSARDFGSCAGPCWWPAQVPDNITNWPNRTDQCPRLEYDWRNLNHVIKR
ncbi:MAG: quinohemoprotein amine dehydrogenase [Deltaproteobacteria bacterium]|nr:MAG: quinohemoprotein amine dehydrogenase [Deltaproteobacteria bacterium]